MPSVRENEDDPMRPVNETLNFSNPSVHPEMLCSFFEFQTQHKLYSGLLIRSHFSKGCKTGIEWPELFTFQVQRPPFIDEDQ